MATTIATKTDLQMLRQELVSAISVLATREELQVVRTELKAEMAELRGEMALMRKDMELQGSAITVRVGSVMVVCLGLLFAALKLT